MQKVIARYQKAIDNQTKRKVCQGRDFFTVDEIRALAFYMDAMMKLQAIEARYA